MDEQELATIANALVAPGKGLLAIDESNRTCNKRFEEVGIAPTEENRRAYRELILTTPKRAGVEEVADATVSCLLRSVPAAVCGIAFLSGGQSGASASAHLNAMNSMNGKCGSRSLAVDLLLRSRDPATGSASLAGIGFEYEGCAGGVALSSEVQQCCATGQVQREDGTDRAGAGWV
jgi:Fructose-bisphosphate aldolase class-I